MTDETIRIAFVCVQNAGRSQMAHAFAERERERREAGDRIEFLTGGTIPAGSIHDNVIEAMGAVGIGLDDRTPREITDEEIERCDIVITMGCSTEDVCPATWRGDSRDWGLADPDGKDADAVRDIRDEIETRVSKLFDELDVGSRGQAAKRQRSWGHCGGEGFRFDDSATVRRDGSGPPIDH